VDAFNLTIDQLVVSGATAVSVEPEQFQALLVAELGRELPRRLADAAGDVSGAIVRMEAPGAEIEMDDLVDMQGLAHAIARRVASLAVDAAAQTRTGKGM